MVLKSKIAALLIAGQLVLAAQPAVAAELIDDRAETSRRGAFAGARVRIPLGETEEKAHAGLALTSTIHSGRTAEMRFAKGLELGFGEEKKLQLSIGGTAVSQIIPRGKGPEEARMGISTLGWVAIGVGVLAVATVALFESCRAGDICGNDDD